MPKLKKPSRKKHDPKLKKEAFYRLFFGFLGDVARVWPEDYGTGPCARKCKASFTMTDDRIKKLHQLLNWYYDETEEDQEG